MLDKPIRYRYLRDARENEEQFSDVRAAFDRACADLEADSAAPLEIWEDGRLVYTMGDICDLIDDWLQWRAGHAAHPAL